MVTAGAVLGFVGEPDELLEAEATALGEAEAATLAEGPAGPKPCAAVGLGADVVSAAVEAEAAAFGAAFAPVAELDAGGSGLRARTSRAAAPEASASVTPIAAKGSRLLFEAAAVGGVEGTSAALWMGVAGWVMKLPGGVARSGCGRLMGKPETAKAGRDALCGV